MNKYFYNDGFRDFGPFTAQELLNKKIRPDYKLRLENTEEWILAKDVEEVAALFKSQQNYNAPAPLYNQAKTSYQQQQPQQPIERDLSFEQQNYQSSSQNYSANLKTTKAPSSWRQKLLVGILAFWLFDNLINWLMTLIGIEMWQGPGKAISILLNIVFAFIPVLIAICIRNENLRVIAIIIAALITFSQIARQAYWAFQ